MTSIRAFSVAFARADRVGAEEKTRLPSIIHSEPIRLHAFGMNLLDLSVLENGEVLIEIRKRVVFARMLLIRRSMHCAGGEYAV